MSQIIKTPSRSLAHGITPALIAVLASVGTIITPATAAAAPIQPYGWIDYSVIPVLFSPTDWSVDSAEVQNEAAAIGSAMQEIREFYARSFGGRTFRLNNLEVVQGFGQKENYHIIWNGKNIYEDGVEFDGNMEAAVVEELHSRGFPTPPAQNEDGYSVLIFVKGAGGYAGARELGSGNGGWGSLGDFCIDSLKGDVPEGAYWWSGRTLQIGAAAHELGHTFGLPHPDAYNGNWETTVMGNWWAYPNLGLNPWDKDFLAANKAAFFVPEPATIWCVCLTVIVRLSNPIRNRRLESLAA
jgi:hypothetical protein